MNSLKIDKPALESARKQFCLDIGLPWEEYLKNPRQRIYIQKAVYKDGTLLNRTEGARNYEGRDDFFHAMICLGQLFLVVDEQIYDWAVEKFEDYPVEWFCEYGNLRMIDEKLKEFGHKIKDTHVYFLPEQESERRGEACGLDVHEYGDYPSEADVRGCECKIEPRKMSIQKIGYTEFCWYEKEEILQFQENNRFTSAICFSKTQPDMLAVAALKDGVLEEQLRREVCSAGGVSDKKLSCSERMSEEELHSETAETLIKTYDQSQMSGMAGVSADGEYLWQIGINVIPEETGKGLAARLVRMLKDEVFQRGKIPFYGTSESHTISQTVGLKAGFVPAWTEVFAAAVPEN